MADKILELDGPSKGHYFQGRKNNDKFTDSERELSTLDFERVQKLPTHLQLSSVSQSTEVLPNV